MSPWKYLLAQGPAIWRYLRLLAFPYGFTVDPDVRVPAVWLGALAWLAILAAAVWAWRARGREWPLWLLTGLLLLLPAASALPSADLYADSRMFLPMLAFAAAAGLLLTRVKTQALAATVAVVLTLLSVVRTAVWLNDKTLWQEAVRRAPLKVRPKVQLSRDLPAAEALDLLQRAQNEAPHDPTVPAEMGKVLLQERQVDPALIEFGQALALDPNNPEYYTDRGVALYMSGLTERARADFERALEIDPNFTEATENLRKLPQAQ
jgi:tetratricopeptide (TPR) repeat protein